MNSHGNCVIIESRLLEADCKSVNDCRFVTTNFISTIMKIQLQSMNVKGRYCFSFDDFEC